MTKNQKKYWADLEIALKETAVVAKAEAGFEEVNDQTGQLPMGDDREEEIPDDEQSA